MTSPTCSPNFFFLLHATVLDSVLVAAPRYCLQLCPSRLCQMNSVLQLHTIPTSQNKNFLLFILVISKLFGSWLVLFFNLYFTKQYNVWRPTCLNHIINLSNDIFVFTNTSSILFAFVDLNTHHGGLHMPAYDPLSVLMHSRKDSICDTRNSLFEDAPSHFCLRPFMLACTPSSFV